MGGRAIRGLLICILVLVLSGSVSAAPAEGPANAPFMTDEEGAVLADRIEGLAENDSRLEARLDDTQDEIGDLLGVLSGVNGRYNVDSFFDVFVELDARDADLRNDLEDEGEARKGNDSRLEHLIVDVEGDVGTLFDTTKRIERERKENDSAQQAQINSNHGRLDALDLTLSSVADRYSVDSFFDIFVTIDARLGEERAARVGNDTHLQEQLDTHSHPHTHPEIAALHTQVSELEDRVAALEDAGNGTNDTDTGGGACTPSTEVCDGVDNDCDGVVDEDSVCSSDPANESTVSTGVITYVGSGDVTLITTAGDTLFSDTFDFTLVRNRSTADVTLNADWIGFEGTVPVSGDTIDLTIPVEATTLEECTGTVSVYAVLTDRFVNGTLYDTFTCTLLGIDVTVAPTGSLTAEAQDVLCEDSNPCTDNAWDEATESCTLTPVPDGRACLAFDGSPGTCQSGACLAECDSATEICPG